VLGCQVSFHSLLWEAAAPRIFPHWWVHLIPLSKSKAEEMSGSGVVDFESEEGALFYLFAERYCGVAIVRGRWGCSYLAGWGLM